METNENRTVIGTVVMPNVVSGEAVLTTDRIDSLSDSVFNYMNHYSEPTEAVSAVENQEPENFRVFNHSNSHFPRRDKCMAKTTVFKEIHPNPISILKPEVLNMDFIRPLMRDVLDHLIAVLSARDVIVPEGDLVKTVMPNGWTHENAPAELIEYLKTHIMMVEYQTDKLLMVSKDSGFQITYTFHIPPPGSPLVHNGLFSGTVNNQRFYFEPNYIERFSKKKFMLRADQMREILEDENFCRTDYYKDFIDNEPQSKIYTHDIANVYLAGHNRRVRFGRKFNHFAKIAEASDHMKVLLFNCFFVRKNDTDAETSEDTEALFGYGFDAHKTHYYWLTKDETNEGFYDINIADVMGRRYAKINLFSQSIGYIPLNDYPEEKERIENFLKSADPNQVIESGMSSNISNPYWELFNLKRQNFDEIEKSIQEFLKGAKMEVDPKFFYIDRLMAKLNSLTEGTLEWCKVFLIDINKDKRSYDNLEYAIKIAMSAQIDHTNWHFARMFLDDKNRCHLDKPQVNAIVLGSRQPTDYLDAVMPEEINDIQKKIAPEDMEKMLNQVFQTYNKKLEVNTEKKEKLQIQFSKQVDALNTTVAGLRKYNGLLGSFESQKHRETFEKSLEALIKSGVYTYHGFSSDCMIFQNHNDFVIKHQYPDGKVVKANVGKFIFHVNPATFQIRVQQHDDSVSPFIRYWHPYLKSSGVICFGASSSIFVQAYRDMNIYKIMMLVKDLLTSYDPANPYTGLEHFVSVQDIIDGMKKELDDFKNGKVQKEVFDEARKNFNDTFYNSSNYKVALTEEGEFLYRGKAIDYFNVLEKRGMI